MKRVKEIILENLYCNIYTSIMSCNIIMQDIKDTNGQLFSDTFKN